MRKICQFLLVLMIVLKGISAFSQKTVDPDCEITFTPDQYYTYDLGSSAGSFTLVITTSVSNCTWAYTDNAIWLTPSEQGGYGSSNVAVSYPANNSYNRSAKITIDGKTLNILQSGLLGVDDGDDGDGDDDDPFQCPTYTPQKLISLSAPIDDENCFIQNEVIEARDFVQLDGSFSYSAATDAPLTIKANADIICNADYETLEIDPGTRDITSKDIGSLPESINVSASGAAIYQIPISLPAGTGGLKPQISVAYNSQSGNGLLGFGWNIAGLSAITRTSQNYYFDNTSDGVDLQMNDRFALNGNRLIVTNLSYGENNAQYHTEIESFSQITSYGTSGNGPSWFRVISKDGTIFDYGNTPESKVEAHGKSTVLMWRLNKVTDINGNFMNYIYKEENGESWIESIEYAGNSNMGVNPLTKVHFYYDRRIDKNTVYVGGSQLPQTVLLRSIKVEDNGTFLNEYKFKYLQDFYTHLSEISELSHDGSQINSTIINWGEDKSQFLQSSYYIDDQNKRFYHADFNGDGKTDFIVLTKADGETEWEKWQMYISLSGIFTKKGEGTLGSDFKGFYIADVDNDGDMDVLWRVNEKITYECNCEPCGGTAQIVEDKEVVKSQEIITDLSAVLPPPPDDDECCDICYYWQESFKFYYFNGLTLARGSTGYDRNLYGSTSETLTLHLGDFNGDGRTDYLTLDENMNLLQLMGVSLSNTPNFDNPDKVDIIDFNGDGKRDIMVLKDANCKIYIYNNETSQLETIYDNGFPTKWHEIFPGDFNGDGKTDVLVYAIDPYNSWSVHFSNGLTYSNSSVIPPLKNVNPGDSDSDNNFFVKDFNGDGKDDILEMFVSTLSTSLINVYYSKGDGNFIKETNTFNRACDEKVKYMFGDFDGDGKQDVFYYGEDNNPIDLLYFHRDEIKHMVHTITDGFNRKVDFSYRPLSDAATTYTKLSGADFPIVDIQSALFVVNNVSVDGIAGEINTTYNYEGARLHKQGKGFLGFSKITKSNSLNNSVTENFYEIDSDNYTSLLSTTNSFIGTDTISDVVYTNDKKTYYSDKCFFPFASTVVSNNILNGTSFTKNNTFDNDGNLTFTTTTDSDGNTESVATTYIVGYNPSVLSLPETVTHTNTIESDTKVTSTFYDYTNFQIDQKTEFYGTSKPIFIDYEYDGFGNTTKAIIEADGEQRYTSYTYNSRGLKLIEKNNNEGFKSTYEYDSFNNLIKSFDPNDALTEYKYNSFGKLIQTETLTGQVIDYTLAWDDGNGPANAEYYTLTESDGVANTKEYSDIFGRVIRKETTGFDNQTILKDYVYNQEGQLIEETDPHFVGDAYATKVYTYDTKGRVETITSDYIDIFYEYDNLTSTVTDNLLNTSYIKTYNAKGLLKTATDDDGTISYNYNGYGKVDEVITQDGTITMAYDDENGNQTSLVDLNAGTMTYTYTGFGELLTQQDSKGNLFTMDYDDLGRAKTKTGYEGTVEYFYDGDKKGLLDKVSHTNGISKEYEYDDLGRLEKSIETIDGQTFAYDYTYDLNGNMSSLTYPNGFAVTKQYDANGYLTQIHNQSTGSLIWEMKSIDALGQIGLTEFGNAIQEDKQYLNQRIESIDASQQFEETYNYNTFGNIEWRQHPSGMKETFTYDNLNRLETSQITGEDQLVYEYYSNGNLKSKPGVGTFNYAQNGGGPHALSSVTNNSLVSTDLQSIDFNSINKVERIQENNYDMQFTYGTGGERKKVRTTQNGTNGQTKYFVGLYEKIDHDSGDIEEFNYITSPDGLIAMQTEDNTNGVNFYYVHKDYLGSIRALTNQAGASLEEYAYDAWGNRVNPITWQPDTRTSFIINRGYTGHEHLDMFNLINMNGRVYDPVISRFISPDNYIQAASNSQSYNRYSYCMNNPLMYTDPSGEKWWHWLIGGGLSGGGIPSLYLAKGIGHATTSWLDGVIDGMDGVAFNGSSWREADSRAQNSWKISKGLFIADEGSDWDKFWQVLSRHTWQQPMTEVGNLYAHFSNNYGSVDVEYFHGATVLSHRNYDDGDGMSIGGYINLSKKKFDEGLDYNNSTLLHEYGHFLQTRQWGLFSISSSVISLFNTSTDATNHKSLWVEQDANARTMSYFEDRMSTNEIKDFSYINQKYYDDRYFRWWYLLMPSPLFINSYNTYNNPN